MTAPPSPPSTSAATTPTRWSCSRSRTPTRPRSGLDKIKDCGGGETTSAGRSSGDWAVIAETDDIADKVVAATEKGSLADDEDFQKWTDEAGDPGVVTLYAGPAAGDYFADHADDMFGFPLGRAGRGLRLLDGRRLERRRRPPSDDGVLRRRAAATRPGLGASPRTSSRSSATSRAWPRRSGSTTAPSSSRPPATAASAGRRCITGGGTADVVESLPGDTGAVLGARLRRRLVRRPGRLRRALHGQRRRRADERALRHDRAGPARTTPRPWPATRPRWRSGSDFDPEAFFSSSDGSDIPVALKIKGDPDEIEKVLDKLRDMAGPRGRTCSSPTRTATPS